MGARRRCCCGDCTIGSDSFDRDDSGSLGDGWPIAMQTGDWDIDGGMAVQRDANGVAIFGTRHPVPDESGVVEVYLPDEELLPLGFGGAYRIIVNAVDEENYHCADYYVYNNPAQKNKIVLGKVTGGGYTSLAEDTVEGQTYGAARMFYARIGEGVFCAGVTNAVLSYVAVIESVIAGGYYSGIGVVNAGSEDLQFDNFEFKEHQKTDPTCPACGCTCEGETIPPTLTAVLTGTGRMSGVTGCTITLEWDRVTQIWYGEGVCCGTEMFSLRLSCPTDPDFLAESTILEVRGCTNSDPRNVSGSVIMEADAQSQCDPFYMLFGPVWVGSSDLACTCGSPFMGDGEFIIEITT